MSEEFPPEGTLLIMDTIGTPLLSCRGITQTYEAIKQAAPPRRCVNGDLVDMGFEPFKKYATTISGKDARAPDLAGIFPGQTVVVDCVFYWSYKTVGGAPIRPVVEGSTYVEGERTFYRPRLTCKVMAPSSVSFDEWPDDTAWQIPLEEV